MIEYFTDDDGIFKEFSAIKIAGYSEPENFPFNGQFTTDVFNNICKWLSGTTPCFSKEKTTMFARNITF